MTDEKDGSGNGSGADGAVSPVAPKNKTAKFSMDQAYADIENYKRIVGEKDALIADLTHQLDEANKVLESQEKARLIGEILPRSKFKLDELVTQSVDDLKNIRVTLDQAMAPRVNSVRFGVQGADLTDEQKGLTVGDLSFETAQKRKRAS